ncbi:Plant invertase/pectin methylesterase inhibitor superfamily protein [Raphanus sativus]|uniref:Pectinesterase inhibitor 9-like n=1 Tax=Raphanus sativus TaxID=3726 RepID=A0A6J0LGE3_RAPSA|nr:pectinesterase inhibitor 9-like [Raphanus sativus]KAJ4905610.1 Plant invertase/pectin methylesterase inhibitor superfamily protein [Raphanus sativus]
MAANNKLILVLLSLLPHIIFSSVAARKDYNTKAYVDSWCRTTLYPNLCVRSLSRYVRSRAMQNPQDLARFALKASLYRAKCTKAFLLKEVTNLETLRPKYYALVHDCLTQIRDSVDQLGLAIAELNRVNRRGGKRQVDLDWHINNLQTWTSTALTDAETCVSQFPGRRMSKLKATIKGKVKNVEETTSNALAFIEHYAAARYRARRP